MREILFRHLASEKAKKKDIFLKEIFEKDGFLAKTETRYLYFIKDIKCLQEEEDLQQWLNLHNGNIHLNKNHFHILKEHNNDFDEDKLICKIGGIFYALVDSNIYTIAFRHSFKVVFTKVSIRLRNQ